MFVGANASGKSNVILALDTLLELLFAKYDVNWNLIHCFYSKEKDTTLTYTFLIDKSEIEYQIKRDYKTEIISERLYVDKEELLNRLGSSATCNFTEQNLYTNISEKTLFLREIYFNTKFRSHVILQKWFDFLQNSISADLYTKNLSKFKEIELQLDEYLIKNGVSEINEFFRKYSFGQQIEYTSESSDNKVAFKTEDNRNMLFFRRENIGTPIPYDLESLGNKNLVMLLPLFFHVIQNGGMLILDEFSSGFHNDLEELLIKYFMEKSRNAQIIFVSHSTNLMTNRLLRPDQIYTVDFLAGTGSVLNRVSKHQPREGQNLEKMYLGGVFNGLPNYSREAE